MKTKYCLITYPDGQPLLAETEQRPEGWTAILGHGIADRLIDLGCTVTPLVAMTPEVIQALEIVLDALWRRSAHDLVLAEVILRELIKKEEPTECQP